MIFLDGGDGSRSMLPPLHASTWYCSSLDVPTNIFSKDSMKKLGEMKKQGAEQKKEESKPKTPAAPVTVTTVSEKAVPQPKKDEAKTQKESQLPTDNQSGIKPSQVKASGFKPINVKPVKDDKAQPPPAKLANIGRLPSKDGVKGPEPGKILPPPAARRAAPRVQQIQNQNFTGTDDLETMDFVRRPTRPISKQDSKEDKRHPTTPVIAVTPSTPAPSETPIPISPTHANRIAPMAKIEKSPPPTPLPVAKPETSTPAGKPAAAKPEEKSAVPKPAEKPEAPKPPEKTEAPKPAEKPEAATQSDKPSEKPGLPKSSDKPAGKPEAPKPSEKPEAPKPSDKPGSPEQKPSTPPAATFQGNAGGSQEEPLIMPTKPKKGNWL